MQSITVFIFFIVTLIHQVSTTTDQLPSVLQIVNKDDRFKILALALEAVGITEADDLEGPYTLFAPNDAAFNAVPRDVVEHLSDPKNKEELGAVLAYHAIPGKAITAEQIQTMSLPVRLESLTGDFVTVTKQNNQIKVNDATVIESNIVAKNGIIHVISKVLIPKSESE